MASDVWVGVDVSKAKVDVGMVGGDAVVEATFVRDVKGLEMLAEQLAELEPKWVVLEATGGYERLVLQVLHAAKLPVAMTLPLRARHFARSMGR